MLKLNQSTSGQQSVHPEFCRESLGGWFVKLVSQSSLVVDKDLWCLLCLVLHFLSDVDVYQITAGGISLW